MGAIITQNSAAFALLETPGPRLPPRLARRGSQNEDNREK